jgi:hypothetical protein
MYAKLKDGVTIDKYPYTLADLQADYPNVTFARPMTTQTLAKFNVVVIMGTTPEYDPVTQYLEEKTPALIGTQWTQQWNVKNYDPETLTARQAAAIAAQEAEYTMALEDHYDAVAQQKRYDNRYTCALRAGYAGPFQAEGIAFAVWMDNCNAMAYQILADVLNGVRPAPTIEQLISELPTISWPS